MFLKQIYDPALSQYAYLIGCQRTEEAILIDPQRDIDRYQKIAEENNFTIKVVTETHIHADFVSGVREFLESSQTITAYLSDEGGADWKSEWAKDHPRVTFVKHGDSFRVGHIQFKVIHTPGHTPEHICFSVEDQGGGADEPMALLSGDFIFVGDVGRPDLLETAAGAIGAREPSARSLYASIQEFAKLPEYLQILPGHGAGSACGKALGSIPSSTVGYEKRFNGSVSVALQDGEDAFVDEILSGQPEPPVYFARMKQLNKNGSDVLGDLPNPPRITSEMIAQLCIKDDPRVLMLDLRSKRGEFMKNHLKGSFHTPSAKFSVSVGSYAKADQNIYLLVENESQVDKAVRELVRMGFDYLKGYALVTDVLSAMECQPHLISTKTIAITAMEQMAETAPGSIILDVRSTDEFNASHVEGALHIPYTRLAAEVSRLPSTENGPLIVHCGSGLRASLAIPYLERHGYQIIYADGLFTDWQKSCAATEACSI